ncbi:unnamed protein product [Adineta ricciae]|uniref:EGF-like domain-containing protein n=2 Tax=Adineta ricciae TaxID=249248 RepID=A0A815LNN7_ADIRI|nr:unnamed protein product [Adineta ricciae]
MDFCASNPSKCLNNGTCIMNYTLNITYCMCDQCHEGDFCQDLRRQNYYNTAYINLIMYIVALSISVLNNTMCLELFLKCRLIRRTNSGIYLIVYSILCLLGSISLVMEGYVNYDKGTRVFRNDPHGRQRFHCIVGVAGYGSASFLCIWFSAMVQLERGLLLFFGATTNFSRKRSIIISVLLFLMAIGCSLPLIVYNCEWDGNRPIKTLRVVLMYFHICIPVLIYLIATILTFIGFARRIHAYGLEKHSQSRLFMKLIYTHLFIFIPPVVYSICYGLFNLVAKYSDPDKGYFACGISTPEYIIKILLRGLTGLPFTITWLLFVYPSRVYMSEFYICTWCGQWTAYIILRFRRCFSKKKDEPRPNEPSDDAGYNSISDQSILRDFSSSA